jgi:hypothetical protein
VAEAKIVERILEGLYSDGLGRDELVVAWV